MDTNNSLSRPLMRLKKLIPILDWLPKYQRSWFRADVIAAVTVWALVVPKAMAVAVIAGMPAEAGLYAAPLALLAYAIFGSSRHLSVGPSPALAIVSFAIVYGLATPGSERFIFLTVTLALLTGLVMIVAGFCRLGVIADFLPKPVLGGFTVGLAISIFFGQFDKILGFDVDPPDFLPELVALVSNMALVSSPTLIVGSVSLALLFLIDKFIPRLPSTITVVALSIVASAILNLESFGVAIVGDIPAGLPSIGGYLDISFRDIYALLPGALATALVCFVTSMAVNSAYATKHQYEVDTNQEMIAVGLANVGAGFSQGFAVEGSASASATADVAGAETQMTSIIAAILVILTVIALTSLFRTLPQASLAAVIIHAVWHQIDFSVIRRYRRIKRIDFWAAVTALVGVLFLGILAGLGLAVLLSLLALLADAKQARSTLLGKLPDDGGYHSIDDYPEAETYPGLIIFRFDERLFFANTPSFRKAVRNAVAADPSVRQVLVDAEGINDIDITGLDMLAELNDELARSEITLSFAQLKSPVRELVRRHGLEKTIGTENFFLSVHAGVDATLEKSEH